MIPLVDMHCHLLAGMDDGPRTPADALEMCRIAYDQGTRMACATAHQNERWSEVTPERIREGTAQLMQSLDAAGLRLAVYPCAEVMVDIDTVARWQAGQLLSIGGRQQYLLMELPHGVFVDLRSTVRGLMAAGVRPILAHPEQQPELLEEPGHLEELIRAGCLMQVSSKNITDPPSRIDGRKLKSWFQRGMVHVLGSDGHSPRRRPPHLAEAYRKVEQWVGAVAADRIASTNGMAILQGLPLRIPAPRPRARSWLSRLW